jgi:hypothetical protein
MRLRGLLLMPHVLAGCAGGHATPKLHGVYRATIRDARHHAVRTVWLDAATGRFRVRTVFRSRRGGRRGTRSGEAHGVTAPARGLDRRLPPSAPRPRRPLPHEHVRRHRHHPPGGGRPADGRLGRLLAGIGLAGHDTRQRVGVDRRRRYDVRDGLPGAGRHRRAGRCGHAPMRRDAGAPRRRLTRDRDCHPDQLDGHRPVLKLERWLGHRRLRDGV